ncbi:hypothetical protein MAM1_0064c03926 [Mucor ambiguus]|uniref:Uncharacterized protein n=1 Tax=Mucor ambiguus TaxID=91626 RepID=A0A0C9M4X3_9FUNG|nr:hypothetical protein MAM1_0064c03926 [Mucor ambiguus]
MLHLITGGYCFHSVDPSSLAVLMQSSTYCELWTGSPPQLPFQLRHHVQLPLTTIHGTLCPLSFAESPISRSLSASSISTQDSSNNPLHQTPPKIHSPAITSAIGPIHQQSHFSSLF